jgi:hypothetical protein
MIDFREFKSKEEIIKYLRKTKDITCPTNAKAEKWLYENIPLESYYQDKIMTWLKENVPKAFVWKAAAGSYSRGGIPDVCCIVNGRYYGFEVKRPFIGVPSKLQEQTIKAIRAAGGKAYFVVYAEEVAEILRHEIELIKLYGDEASQKAGESV